MTGLTTALLAPLALATALGHGASRAGESSYDAALVGALGRGAVGESVAVADWPVAPGKRASLALRRIDVYAPGARLFAVEAGGSREIGRSDWAFWLGQTDGRSVVVAVEPSAAGPEVAGVWSEGAAGAARAERVGSNRLRWVTMEEEAAGGVPCGVAAVHQALAGGRHRGRAPREAAAGAAALGSLHQAVIAVDADNEFVNGRFGGNTANAANFIAALFANLRAIYERDLLVRPLQGTTFLRVAPDPYAGGAIDVRLFELSDHWFDNHASVPRAATMLVSGRTPAQGLAFVEALCDHGTVFEGAVYGGYSVSQMQNSGSPTPTPNDVLISAHELGHTFGAMHTHCRWDDAPAPFIDQCRGSEPSGEGYSCYSGTPSCPAPATYSGIPDVEGTLMSYCHLLGSCSAATVFHSRTLAEYIEPHLAGAVGTCVFPLSNAENLVFHTVTPCRVVDTRGGAPIAGGALGAGEERVWTVAGECGLPSAASGLGRAVSVNVTVTGGGAAGTLSFTAGDLAPPPAATAISFKAGDTRANNAVLPLSITPTQGALRVRNDSAAPVHVIVDVNGYFRP